MKATQRPGWIPSRLWEHREAHGLTLEAAGERLRRAASRHGLAVPAANFQTPWGTSREPPFPARITAARTVCLIRQRSLNSAFVPLSGR